MHGITEFVCWAAVVAAAAAFALSLLMKWGALEWLQVHAPNDFFHELFSCKFCLSWWASVVIAVAFAVVSGQWLMLAIPVCSTVITRELW